MQIGRWAVQAVMVLALLWLLPVLGGSRALGDRLQIALPVVGAACTALDGKIAGYAVRLAGALVVVHGTKFGLGAAPVNLRPSGRPGGFPSGHAAAAVYGASAMVRTCAGLVPGVGPVAVLAAGFVGGSRLSANRHTLPQVMAGAVVGLGFDRCLRSLTQQARLRGWLRRTLGRWIGQGLGRLRAVAGRCRVRGLALARRLQTRDAPAGYQG